MITATLSFHVGEKFNIRHNSRDNITVHGVDKEYETLNNYYHPNNTTLEDAYQSFHRAVLQFYGCRCAEEGNSGILRQHPHHEPSKIQPSVSIPSCAVCLVCQTGLSALQCKQPSQTGGLRGLDFSSFLFLPQVCRGVNREGAVYQTGIHG